MEKYSLDPSDYDLDFESENKADSMIALAKWGIPFDIQFFIRKNADLLKDNQFSFFQKAYKNDGLKKQDPRFEPFKCFLSKVLRKTGCYNFSDDQIHTIVESGTFRRPIEIAADLFPELGFDKESRNSLNGISSSIKSLLDAFDIVYEGPKGNYSKITLSESDYRAPETDDQVLAKIKKYVTDVGWAKSSLDAQQRKSVRFIKTCLSAIRFLKTINSIRDVHSRQMFEQEFIKSIYDKPDLIPEDVNGYIDLSQEFVNQTSIQERVNVLDDDFRKSNEGDDKIENKEKYRLENMAQMTAAQKQLNDSKERIQQLRKELTGAREKRLKEENSSEQSLFKVYTRCCSQEYREKLINARRYYDSKILEKEFKKIENADKTTEGEAHGISFTEIMEFFLNPVEG